MIEILKRLNFKYRLSSQIRLLYYPYRISKATFSLASNLQSKALTTLFFILYCRPIWEHCQCILIIPHAGTNTNLANLLGLVSSSSPSSDLDRETKHKQMKYSVGKDQIEKQNIEGSTPFFLYRGNCAIKIHWDFEWKSCRNASENKNFFIESGKCVVEIFYYNHIDILYHQILDLFLGWCHKMVVNNPYSAILCHITGKFMSNTAVTRVFANNIDSWCYTK